MSVATEIRTARLAAGLTQRQLARRVRTSQSRLATYESGAATPSADTLRRILAAARPLPSVALDRHRDEIVAMARRLGLVDVRVFGSVVRGEDHIRSDIDLLATALPGTTLFDVNGFAMEAEALLGCPVDVLTEGALDTASEVRREARPL